jgi:branched-chain amino acid transport system substrate-binding protein
MKIKTFLAGASLLAVVAILAGCGSSNSNSSAATGSAAASGGGSGKPVTILFVGDFSGANKQVTDEQYGGLESGVTYWNAHGGFNGAKATVTKIDDNGQPNTAISQTIQYLTSHPKPTMVWAGTESDEVAAMIPLMKREGLLGMSINDGNLQCVKDAQTDCPTFFSIGGGADVIDAAAAAAFKRMDVTSVGILQETLAFTQSETPAMVQALTKAGIKNSTVTFPDTAVDVTAELSKLKSNGATGIYAEALGPAAGYTLAGRAQLGWNAPVIFDAAGSSFDVSKLVSNQSYLKNAYVNISPPTNGCLKIPGVKLMVSNAATAGAKIGTLPLYVAAFGWDGMVLLHNAIDQAKSTDATSLASAIVNMPASAQSDPLYTLSKRVAFTNSNHENQGVTTDDYDIVNAGPVTNGQLHPTCKP